MERSVQRLNRYLEIEDVQFMIDHFLEKGEVRVFAKNEFFLREGKKSDLIGYIKEGGFRHLIEASDGTQRIAGYSFVNDFITTFPAFDSTVSAVSIQAYKESTVYFLKREEILSQQSWEYRCRVAEIAITDVYGRLLLMHIGTPEERYKSLVGRFPDILNEVSLKEIASFLRMTPETLSRIRKKMLLNKNY
jgi:CRP-like cAMP-binding protein